MRLTMTTEIRPDLQALVAMAVSKLDAIAKTVPNTDDLISVKTAKNLKQCRGLLDVIREEINDIRKAAKAAPVKKSK